MRSTTFRVLNVPLILLLVLVLLLFLSIVLFVLPQPGLSIGPLAIKEETKKPHSKMPDKLDAEGNYIPFYGYTVVSMVSDRTKMPRLCEDFFKRAPTLASFVSPLPASSYHATVYDIFTQRKIPDKYLPLSGLVPSLRWTDVNNSLRQDMSRAQNHCEDMEGGLKFLKKGFRLGSHPGDTLVIQGTLSNREEISALVDSLRQVFVGIGKPVKTHHITLGYLFKEANDDDRQKINEELKGLWDQVQDEIELDRPNVCYFETMKEFVPFKEMVK